ncbi:hypothetical protein ALO89_200033 [Pseudomonas coronafaciens pv. porri]|nr:hypothetical protein ALO89_200033 [Pseudomonas coronafaciens pv. porri]
MNIGAGTGDAAVAAGTLASNTVAFGQGTGTLVFNHTNSGYVFAPVISGTGNLNVLAGMTILTASNIYSGGTTISGGMLQIGNGGTQGSIVGNVVDNATLAFNHSDALTFSGAISGSGTLTQSGTGTLTLAGANTYRGGTTISAGTLQVGNGGTQGSLQGNVVDNSALVLNRSDVLTVGGAISGTGSVTQSGTGTTILTGANTYSGGTTISGGTLQVGSGGTQGSLQGDVVDNAALVLNRSDVLTVGGAIRALAVSPNPAPVPRF